MLGIFKRKIPAETAIKVYFDVLVEKLNESWEEEISALNQILGKHSIDPDNGKIFIDFLSAIISVESRSVMNTVDPNVYTKSFLYLFEIIRSIDELGEECVDAIQKDFLPEMRKAENKGHLMIDGALKVLFEKLKIPKNPIYGTAIMAIITANIGIWSNLHSKYKIV